MCEKGVPNVKKSYVKNGVLYCFNDTKNTTNILLENEFRGILREARKRCPRTGRFIKTESPKLMEVNSE